METAGEGGPWGMALLAAYAANRETGETLEDYLESKVFVNTASVTAQPDPEDVIGMDAYICQFKQALAAERAAVEYMK